MQAEDDRQNESQGQRLPAPAGGEAQDHISNQAQPNILGNAEAERIPAMIRKIGPYRQSRRVSAVPLTGT